MARTMMTPSHASTAKAGAKRKAGKLKGRFTLSKGDRILRGDIEGAVKLVGARGLLKQPSKARISTRLPPGLIDVAKKRSGIKKDSELIKAALALMVGHDSFTTWFLENRGKLNEDFELAL